MPKDNVIFDNVQSMELRESLLIMRAITHPLRLKIISFIDKHRSVSVHKLYTGLNLDQSIASQQLHILRSANLVRTQRDGKFVYYQINYTTLARVNGLIEEFRKK